MPKEVLCPTCSKPVPWNPASKWRPFCSERCRLIDLGEWIYENHRIVDPADSTTPDLPTKHKFPDEGGY